MRLDLHCHSSASDGCLSPAQVAARLAACGAQVAALADHHTCASYERFRAALNTHGVQCVTGVEIFVESELGSLHLLAYGFDARDKVLLRVMRVLERPVWGPMRHWMERSLKPGAPSKHQHEPAAVAHGGLDCADALRLIHDAGGRAFLAHPLLTARNTDHLEAQLEMLCEQGLDGIEAFYKPYKPEAQQQLRDLAQRFNILTSAGSDFHGPAFPGGAEPGCEMPDDEWRRLAQALGLEPGS